MSGSIKSSPFWGQPAFAVIGVAAIAVLVIAAIGGGILLGGAPGATPTPGTPIAAVETPTGTPGASPSMPASPAPEETPTATTAPTAGATPTAAPTPAPTATPTMAPPRDTATPIANPCAGPGSATSSASAGLLDTLFGLTPGHFGHAGAFPAGGGYDTATLLANGKVLLVGGGKYGDRAEIYDPTTNTFTSTGSLVHARRTPLAALASNGNVLLLGGGPVTGCVDIYNSEVELYNPATGHFSSLGNPMPGDNYTTMTRLSNGRILIAGGQVLDDSGDTSRPSSLIYDATATADHPNGTFTPTAATIPNGAGATTTVLPDGRVLFTGGYGPDGPTAAAGLYDPATDTFNTTGSMHVVRNNATATLLSAGDGVLVAGGDDGATIALTAEVYDPATGTFAWTAGSMTGARDGAVAALLPGGKVLIVSGRTGSAADLASAELYDPVTGRFATTGSMTTAREGVLTATPLPNGMILVVGAGSADLYRP
jgi:hypothetical protein